MTTKLAGILLCGAMLLAACGGDTPAPASPVVVAPESSPGPPADPSAPPAAEQPTPEAVDPATGQPVESPVAPPVEPTPVATIDPLGNPIAYNLPPALLTTESGLYVSPNRDDLITPVIVPAGQTIYLMGRNATASHLRAVWNTAVGWIPVSFTSYSGDQAALQELPIFEQEPPRCAEPVTTQFNLDSVWAADQRTRIAVVVDLFRSRYGDFPQSYLLLTVNGVTVESSRRPIVERGQFSLKDIVFSLPAYLQPGDTLGYQLDTTSAEALAFMATIFRVPEGCVWDID